MDKILLKVRFLWIMLVVQKVVYNSICRIKLQSISTFSSLLSLSLWLRFFVAVSPNQIYFINSSEQRVKLQFYGITSLQKRKSN